MKASVLIQIAAHNKSSFLKHAYAEPPFKVANITEARNPQLLELMLMSSSPGVLDDDRYLVDIELAANSSLRLTTQSYQRLFRMVKGAEQDITVRMLPGSSLVYLPHPVVPHESAVFRANNKLYLSHGCNVIWGEVLTCGRKLNGERFLFSFYHSTTEIFLNGRMVVKENLRMAPGTIEVDTIGQMEGFTHQASLICLSPAYIINDKKTAVTSCLAEEKEIAFGITTAPVHGVIIRILGNGAEQLFDCLKKLAGIMNFSQNPVCSNFPEKTAEVTK
ncbi:MAG: urease accessory protein UreD [Chitinophagaceae bacterium]